jgi:hypothetical protein
MLMVAAVAMGMLHCNPKGVFWKGFERIFALPMMYNKG